MEDQVQGSVETQEMTQVVDGATAPATTVASEVTPLPDGIQPEAQSTPKEDTENNEAANSPAPQMPAPRPQAEIEAEYSQIAEAAGKAFFQREFHDLNLKQFSRRHAQLQDEMYRLNEIQKTAKLKAARENLKKKPLRAADYPVGSPGEQATKPE